MGRVNIYSTDETTGEKTQLGWFDPGDAIRFDQGTKWDGYNHIGVVTGSQWIDECLYRTKGGRWVLNHDASRYCNGPDTYQFLTDEQAKDWLLRSERNDDAVERYFGEVEEERGPGRPAIGGEALVNFGEDLLTWLGTKAQERGIRRARLIRELLEAARDSYDGDHEYFIQERDAQGRWSRDTSIPGFDDLTPALDRRDEENAGVPDHMRWQQYRVVDRAGRVYDYSTADA